MSQYVSEALRKLVVERAGHRCEYCRMPDFLAFVAFHVDHVISIKHDGKTVFSNLAYACPICNCLKGSDIGTVGDEEHTLFIPFFNPRRHNWFEHFEVESGLILPRTPIAEGTIRIFQLNDLNRIIERQGMEAKGLYP